MPRRRDPLDRPLHHLCSLAESTVILLRDIPVAHQAYSHFRFDPDGLARQLTALAIHGRQAHTDRLQANGHAETAMEEARDCARRAYKAQTDYRKRLSALATLMDDPIVTQDLIETRRRINLTAVRIQGALDMFRRLRDHLRPASHPIHRHPLTASMYDEVHAFAAELEACIATRDELVRTQRLAVAEAEKARSDLQAILRKVRQMGEIAATLPRFDKTFLDHLATQRVKSPPKAREGGSKLTSEGACMPNEGACLPNEGDSMPNEGDSMPNAGACLPNASACMPNEGARVSGGESGGC